MRARCLATINLSFSTMNADVCKDQIGVDILSEFIEVLIHNILYNRKLYPSGVFEKRVKYNVPVQMCLHQDVSSYISSVIESIKSLLSKGHVDKISVVILHGDTSAPIERFVLEVSGILNNWKETDPYLYQLEQSLRSLLLKLNVSDCLLQPSTKGATWTVHVHTVTSTFAALEEQFIQKDFPWTEAEEKQKLIKNVQMVPLKNITSDIFNLQFFVEEASNLT